MNSTYFGYLNGYQIQLEVINNGTKFMKLFSSMTAEIIRLHMTRFIIISLMLIFVGHQQAQANSDNHSEDTDNKTEDSYQRGNADGESARLVDYPYKNSDCPVVHSSAYCLGWIGGYETGFNAQKTDDESNRLNDNENSDNDDK